MSLHIIELTTTPINLHIYRVDDIEDDSQLRRGIPVAHKIFGVPQTINTANYVYFLAYQELSALRPKVQRHTCDSSAGPDSRFTDDSPAAEMPDFSKRLISNHDLDLIVIGLGHPLA